MNHKIVVVLPSVF